MSVHDIGVAIASMGIARMWPCSAIVAPATMCGATPTSLYRRECGVESHVKLIWLCPVHGAIVACGGGICRECAERGGITGVVRIFRITEPLRLN